MIALLKQSHIEVREMAAGSGQTDKDTVHLLLRLPRGMNAAGVTTLLAGLEGVHSLHFE